MQITKREIMILSFILLLGLGLRILGIGHGLPTEQRISYYFPQGIENANPDELYTYGMLGTAQPDEADMLGAVSNMDPSKLNFNPHFFGYGGCLHFFTLALFLKIASLFKFLVLTPVKEYYFLNPLEFSKMYLVGRSMALIFAISTIVFVYLLAKSLYGRKTGIISALFLAVLPWHVIHSHIMLPDIPTVCWTTLALYFCVNLYKTSKLKWYVLTGLAAGLGGATKYYALLLIFPIIISHLMAKPEGQKSYLTWLFNKKIIACFATIILITIFIGNPYMFVSLKETLDDVFFRTPELAFGRLFPSDPLVFLSNIFKNIFSRSLIYVSIAIKDILSLLLLAWGFIYLLYKRNKADIFLLSWIIPYYLIVSGLLWCSPGYILPVMPVLVILIARVISDVIVETRIKDRKGLLAWPLILIISFNGIFTSLKYDSLLVQKDTRLDAAEWISQNVPEGSTIGLSWSARRASYWATPPFSKSKYRVKIVQDQSLELNLLGVDYVILTGPLQMMLLPEIAEEFQNVASFKRNPSILGHSFKRRQLSDWFIYNFLMHSHRRIYRSSDFSQPDIKIFKRPGI